MLALLLLPSCSLFADDQDTLPVCELSLRSIDESEAVDGLAYADAAALLGAPMVRALTWTDGAFPLPEASGSDVLTLDWSIVDGSLAEASWTSTVLDSCADEGGLYFESTVALESAMLEAQGTIGFLFTDATQAGIRMAPEGAAWLDNAMVSDELTADWSAACGSAASGARADVGRWLEYGQPNTLNIEGPCTNGTAVLARGTIAPAE